ncbi:MAG: extracellular solute-binding protein, partial [Peptococcaceae bacterium]|nr:extracellular solute-binding protein [Peptococcaceae bacterium]
DESASTNEEWKAKIMADFDQGKEPDVLFYFTGADADSIVRSGKVVSISDIRKEYPDYASNMKDSMMPVSAVNGRQYAVPVNGYWEGLFVNKKVLAACGVSVPGVDYQWRQFLADCQTIREHGYTPIACSLGEIPHYWFEFCILNQGSISDHLRLPSDVADETGKKWVSGLTDIKDLYERGFFPEDTLTATDGETNLLMIEHKAAFMIDGSWKVGWFQSNAENIDDFAVAYVPGKSERSPTEVIGGFSMGYYITKKAWDNPAKRKACVDFISAMTTDEVVSSFGELSMTALKNGTMPPQQTDPLVLSVMDMNKNCTGPVGAVQDLLSASARASLFANVPAIVTGAVTAEDAVRDCLSMK